MSNPVRIRIRCTEAVRKAWEKARGEFDMTHAELAYNAAKFILQNPGEFRRFCDGEERDSPVEGR